MYTAPGLPGMHAWEIKGEKGMLMAVVKPMRGSIVVSRCMVVLICGCYDSDF